MATALEISDGAIRVVAAGVQPLASALEVANIDQIDALLQVFSVEGSPGTGFVLTLTTGMQTESDDGWVDYVPFTAVTAANKSDKKNFAGLMRYVRWRVTSMGSYSAVTFSLRGMGRLN